MQQNLIFRCGLRLCCSTRESLNSRTDHLKTLRLPSFCREDTSNNRRTASFQPGTQTPLSGFSLNIIHYIWAAQSGGRRRSADTRCFPRVCARDRTQALTGHSISRYFCCGPPNCANSFRFLVCANSSGFLVCAVSRLCLAVGATCRASRRKPLVSGLASGLGYPLCMKIWCLTEFCGNMIALLLYDDQEQKSKIGDSSAVLKTRSKL